MEKPIVINIENLIGKIEIKELNGQSIDEIREKVDNALKDVCKTVKVTL